MTAKHPDSAPLLERRGLLLLGAGAITAAGFFGMRRGLFGQAIAAEPRHFEVTHTEAEWRAKLTPAQYRVLREEGTERAFTSELNHEKRAGRFDCAGCALPLFDAKTKFDSGTGWPSFWKPMPDAVNEISDNAFGMRRTAVECHRCGGHLGHVFDDGPAPTGLRYCMNGVALTFAAA